MGCARPAALCTHGPASSGTERPRSPLSAAAPIRRESRTRAIGRPDRGHDEPGVVLDAGPMVYGTASASPQRGAGAANRHVAVARPSPVKAVIVRHRNQSAHDRSAPIPPEGARSQSRPSNRPAASRPHHRNATNGIAGARLNPGDCDGDQTRIRQQVGWHRVTRRPASTRQPASKPDPGPACCSRTSSRGLLRASEIAPPGYRGPGGAEGIAAPTSGACIQPSAHHDAGGFAGTRPDRRRKSGVGVDRLTGGRDEPQSTEGPGSFNAPINALT